MSLGLFGTFLDPAGKHPVRAPSISGLGAIISISLLGALMQCDLAAAWKSHPIAVFLLLTQLALLLALGYLQQGAGP